MKKLLLKENNKPNNPWWGRFLHHGLLNVGVEMKLLFLDVETTGVDNSKNGIIQLSGIIEIDGVIKEEFNFNRLSGINPLPLGGGYRICIK